MQQHSLRPSQVQRAYGDPHTFSCSTMQFLQRTIGNRAAAQMFQRATHHPAVAPPSAASPQATGMVSPPLASVFPLQQKEGEHSAPLDTVSQERTSPQEASHRGGNTTGLPRTLQTCVEQLSGLSLADVQVHYHSSQPAEVEALAYTQGTAIYVGPGQEQHLAHEAWHVVQQKQGRVQPTMQAKGIAINDDTGLEHEADVMGARANQMDTSTVQKKDLSGIHPVEHLFPKTTLSSPGTAPIQRAVGFEFQTEWPIREKKGEDQWESLPRGVGIFKDASGKLKGAPASLDQRGKFNFLIESDDDNEGGSEAEFITAPFSDQASIDLAMTTMTLFRQAIADTPTDTGRRRLLSDVNTRFTQRVEAIPDPQSISLEPQMLKASTRVLPNIAFGDPDRDKFDDEGILTHSWFDKQSAQAQSTFSISLDTFADVIGAFNVSLSALNDEHIPTAARFHSAVMRARRFTASLPPEQDWKRLTGFLALVIGALWAAGSYFTPDVDYVKSSFPVMLRNDFHALWAKLQAHEQARFSPDLVLALTGMEGNAPIFPTGFEVEALEQAFFGPTRRQWLDSIINPDAHKDIAQAGDKQVVETNVQREDYRSDDEYEAAKQGAVNELAQKDLLSRGWVRASAYSMGAFETPPNREVRVEWRAFRPRPLALQNISTAVTNVFTRYTDALTAVSPTVSVYNPTKRKRELLTLDQAEKMGLKNVQTDEVINSYEDFKLHRAVYYDPQGRDYWHLIDVISPGGEDEKDTRDKEAYEDYLKEEVIPKYRFMFETVRREDLAELGLNPDDQKYATIPSEVQGGAMVIHQQEEEEEPGPDPGSPAPTPSRKRHTQTSEEEPEDEPASTLKQDFSRRIIRNFGPNDVDLFFGTGTLNAIKATQNAVIARELDKFRGQDGYNWLYMEEEFGLLLFRRLDKADQ